VNIDQLPFWQRPYFWELVDVHEVPTWQKAWHVSRWTGEKVFQGMEFVGEIVADVLGLNDSRYQWVIDAAENDEARRKAEAEIEELRAKELRHEALQAHSRDLDLSEGGLIKSESGDPGARSEITKGTVADVERE